MVIDASGGLVSGSTEPSVVTMEPSVVSLSFGLTNMTLEIFVPVIPVPVYPDSVPMVVDVNQELPG